MDHHSSPPADRQRHPKDMKKLSLRSFAIVVPLCVAVMCAIWSAHLRSKQTTAPEAFHRAVDSERLLPVLEAEKRLAEREVKRMLAQAAASDLIVFDGESRVAQIQPNMLDYGGRSLDGLSLHTIGDDTGSMTFQLPIGTRIKSISFEDDALIVTVFGDLEIGGKVLSIPEENPEVHKVSWARLAAPPNNTLTTSIATRSRKK